MSEITQLLIDLFVIFLAAKLAAEVFERIGQPPVIGELLAGVLIGPFALGLVGRPDAAGPGGAGGQHRPGSHHRRVVVIMSILTTLVVPPVLRVLYAGQPETAISREDAESQAGRLPELGAQAQRAPARAA